MAVGLFLYFAFSLMHICCCQWKQNVIIPTMPIVTPCDDGKTNLTVDWNGWAEDYWCFGPRWTTNPEETEVKATAGCDPKRPPQAFHSCMNKEISYKDKEIPPTSGDHRPTWPVYGEYFYAPPQRWLHSLEHGAVVLLYHPCADGRETEKLKELVRGCLRRHLITPYNKLPRSTPFALLTWGCKLLLASADEMTATQFMKKHAKRGAEDIDKDGNFSDQLILQAKVVTDVRDSVICPNATFLGNYLTYM